MPLELSDIRGDLSEQALRATTETEARDLVHSYYNKWIDLQRGESTLGLSSRDPAELAQWFKDKFDADVQNLSWDAFYAKLLEERKCVANLCRMMQYHKILDGEESPEGDNQSLVNGMRQAYKVIFNVKAYVLELGRLFCNMYPHDSTVGAALPLGARKAAEEEDNVEEFDKKSLTPYQHGLIKYYKILETCNYRRAAGKYFVRITTALGLKTLAYKEKISIKDFVGTHAKVDDFEQWKQMTGTPRLLDDAAKYLANFPQPHTPDLQEDEKCRSFEGDKAGRGAGVYDVRSEMFFPYCDKANWGEMATTVEKIRKTYDPSYTCKAPTDALVCVVHLACAFPDDIYDEVCSLPRRIGMMWRGAEDYECKGCARVLPEDPAFVHHVAEQIPCGAGLGKPLVGVAWQAVHKIPEGFERFESPATSRAIALAGGAEFVRGPDVQKLAAVAPVPSASVYVQANVACGVNVRLPDGTSKKFQTIGEAANFLSDATRGVQVAQDKVKEREQRAREAVAAVQQAPEDMALVAAAQNAKRAFAAASRELKDARGKATKSIVEELVSCCSGETVSIDGYEAKVEKVEPRLYVPLVSAPMYPRASFDVESIKLNFPVGVNPKSYMVVVPCSGERWVSIGTHRPQGTVELCDPTLQEWLQASGGACVETPDISSLNLPIYLDHVVCAAGTFYKPDPETARPPRYFRIHKGRTWEECEMKEMDQIFHTQEFCRQDCFYLYGLQGRLKFFVKERDSHDITLMLIGEGGTGKTTALKIDQEYWPVHLRGILNPNTQPQWGMGEVAHGKTIYCNEISSDLNVVQEEWQISMDGGIMSLSRKFRDPWVGKWVAQHFWVGNGFPVKFKNDQDQVSRRCCGVQMKNPVARRDGSIMDRMLPKLGQLLRKEILAYDLFIELTGTYDPMSRPEELPPAFKSFFFSTRALTDPVAEFMKQCAGDKFVYDGNGEMFLKDFKRLFDDFRVENNIGKPPRWTSATYSKALRDNSLDVKKADYTLEDGTILKNVDVIHGISAV